MHASGSEGSLYRRATTAADVWIVGYTHPTSLLACAIIVRDMRENLDHCCTGRLDLFEIERDRVPPPIVRMFLEYHRRFDTAAVTMDILGLRHLALPPEAMSPLTLG